MKFRIPFTFTDPEVLRRRSKLFIRPFRKRKGKLDKYLKNSGVNFNEPAYWSICARNFLMAFLFLVIVSMPVAWFLQVPFFYLVSIGFSLVVAGFVFFNQINYPRIFSFNKSRDVERNLIPALQDSLVQLNSGVPLFSILVNIGNADYGQVSEEFRKVVNEINSGVSEIAAMEKYAVLNESPYFKRVLWQISNGMRSGGNMEIVIQESINNLNEEQAIQIQTYGSKLNPIIMFYMIIAVILPSLGVTFLIIISSLIGLSGELIRVILIVSAVFIILMQFMFLGFIKSRRPRLL